MTKRRRRKQNSAKAALRKAWAALSAKLREDRGRCELCGSQEHLQSHHVLAKRLYPGFTLDERNLVVLCARCHWRYHKGGEAELFRHLREHRP